LKKLEPTIGLTATVAIGVSAMLGSGIFVLPGLAFAKTGPSVWLAYLAAGLSVLPAALSKAELATAMPASGGTYVYLARAFGPLAGTISGLGLWMSLLLKSAFALVGFAAYLHIVAPNIDIRVAALGLLVGITVLNILGVSKVGKAQIFVVSISVGGLVALMAMTGSHYTSAHFDNPFPKGTGGFLAAAGFVFVSYAGVTKVAALAEEVKNPERNLPLAMFLALAIAAVLYGTVTFCMVAVLPPDILENNPAPIYYFAKTVGGATFGKVAVFIAILTMTAMATAGLLAASRFPFAMSRDRLLPDKLTHIHSRFHTPVYCIIATALLMAVAILFLEIGPIAKLASAFKICIFMAVNIAIIVLRESRVAWYKPKYRSPLYPYVQIFGLITEAILLLTMGLGPAVAMLVIIGSGTLLFYFYGKRRTTQRGVMVKLGKRKELLQESYSKSTQEIRRAAAPDAPHTLVALDSTARSPETLAEVGIALSGNNRVKVMHITEVPEQFLELDALEDSIAVTSLQRRILAMAQERNREVEFEPIATHDQVASIHRAASELAPEWTLLEWSGRRSRDIFIRNPRLWLHRHMPCNLALFHDVGIRYIRKILVYAVPGPDDALVVETADHLAETYGASLTFAAFVKVTHDPTEAQRKADYLDQIQKLVKGGSETLIIKGTHFVEAVSAASVGFDLLVMGAPNKHGMGSLFGTANDRLTDQAGCSVLEIRTPHEQTHRRFQPDQESDVDLMAHLLDECLQVDAKGTSKNTLFQDFGTAFAGPTGVDASEIIDALWAREKTQNTSVGYGVALPHATLPGLHGTSLGVFTLAEPLEYGAVDGQPVDLFVVTLGPPGDRQTHLVLLATLAKLILRTDLLSDIRKADGPAGIRQALGKNLSLLNGD
jgi:APA family basic amino acid/polyamine antiporter